MQVPRYSNDVMQAQGTHAIMHQSLDFNLNLHRVCAAYVLHSNEQNFDQLFKQLCLRAITL